MKNENYDVTKWKFEHEQMHLKYWYFSDPIKDENIDVDDETEEELLREEDVDKAAQPKKNKGQPTATGLADAKKPKPENKMEKQPQEKRQTHTALKGNETENFVYLKMSYVFSKWKLLDRW